MRYALSATFHEKRGKEKMDSSDRRKYIYRADQYGICGNGQENNTAAINNLIQLIWENGGGILLFSKGIYRMGSVRLRSNVKLFLEEEAVICGSGLSTDFPELDYEAFYGREQGAVNALLWAVHEAEIEIYGSGIIDGRGSAWWHRKDGRRPCVIEFSDCRNVKIRDIKIINSPFWTIHPFDSRSVIIDHIWIQNPPNSPNTDGINPESCSDVHIKNCIIDVGDDCIALKAGKENCAGREYPPCQDIKITDCIMKNGHGGVVIGSELSGGIRNVLIQRLNFFHTDRGIRLKTKRLRGNIIENIVVSDIVMEDIICPLVINCYYRGTTRPEDYEVCSSKEPMPINRHTPLIRNIRFERIEAKKVKAAAAYMEGLPELPIENCIFSDVFIEMDRENHREEEPAMTYERKLMKKSGFWARNLKNITMENVVIKNAVFEFDIL